MELNGNNKILVTCQTPSNQPIHKSLLHQKIQLLKEVPQEFWLIIKESNKSFTTSRAETILLKSSLKNNWIGRSKWGRTPLSRPFNNRLSKFSICHKGKWSGLKETWPSLLHNKPNKCQTSEVVHHLAILKTFRAPLFWTNPNPHLELRSNNDIIEQLYDIRCIKPN